MYYIQYGREVHSRYIRPEAQSAEVNMPLRSDIRKGYGPTYHTIYDISYGEFATDKPFCVRRPNIFETTPFFTQRLICHVCTEPRHNTYFSMFAQSPCDVLFYNPDEEPCTDTIYIYNSSCCFNGFSRLLPVFTSQPNAIFFITVNVLKLRELF